VSEDPFPHRPVLYKETIQYLAPSSPKRYLDCTAGAGGHSKGILTESAPSGELLALDLDPLAIQLTRQRLSPFGDRAQVVARILPAECRHPAKHWLAGR
jgi:16S rRNA (cytosine1402-N4)-methyltransferase